MPHLPPLADDYIYDYGKVREFYNGDFRDPAAFERQAESVRSRHIPREDLAAVLAEQNRSYGCGPETLGAIEKIVRDRGLRRRHRTAGRAFFRAALHDL